MNKHFLKTFKIAMMALLVLAIISSLLIFSIWQNEIRTIFSIEKIREGDDSHDDGAVYKMYVKGDYYIEEFIAQGGVKSDAELIDFVTSHITKGFIPMTIEELEIACSSFTAKTEDDHFLFARNYDFDKTNTMIVYTQADGDRHATISTVDLQFLGIDKDAGIASLMDKITSLAATYTPLDGINDKGVAVGIYMTYQGLDTVPTDQNTAKPDITSTTLLRLILDYADDLDEAIEIAKAYDMHDSAMTSYHYMVADSSGRSAILEYVGTNDREDNDSTKRELVITYSDDDARIGKIEADADYQVVTNFIIQPDYYQDEDQSEKKGFDRYERIYQELSKTNGILKSDQEAMDILKIVGRRLWDNDDQNGLTVHSVVYDLSAKKALWVSNENFDDPGAIFELSFE